MKLRLLGKVSFQTLKNFAVCDIIKAKGGVEMYRDRGVYVFPDKDRMKIFAYDCENAVEYPSLTFAEQLVDFLEIDMTPFHKAINNLKSYDDNMVNGELLMNIFHSIYFLADSFCVDRPIYSFLMDIGPAEVSKRNSEFSEVLSEYDKAVNRNFKRVERFEEKQSNEKHGEDLDYAEYSEWLVRIRKMREQLKNGEICDEVILMVVHELD